MTRVEPGQRDPLTDAEFRSSTLEMELAMLNNTIAATEMHVIALKLRAKDIEDKLANAKAREESKRKVGR